MANGFGQLHIWGGEFGTTYQERMKKLSLERPLDIRIEFMRTLLQGRDIFSVLEAGCGCGDNLIILKEVLDLESPENTTQSKHAPPYRSQGRLALLGIDPNLRAREMALENGLLVKDGTLQNLPSGHASYDLTMTRGVLIHVDRDSVDRALDELYRVAKNYILVAEYFSQVEEEIEYIYPARCWADNYGSRFIARHKDCHLVTFKDDLEYPKIRWWLIKKSEGYPGR